MLKKVLLLLLFAATFNAIQCYKVVECLPQRFNISIEQNELVVLQTSKFPKSAYNEPDDYICQTKIYTKSNNTYLWFIMSNGLVYVDTLFSDHYYDSGNTYNCNFDIEAALTSFNSLYLDVMNNFDKDIQQWTGFQAIISSFEMSAINEYCPFVNQTFDFSMTSDLTIPIFKSMNTNSSCKWDFKTAENQILKVVVFLFEQYSSSVEFVASLYSDGNLVKNFTKTINSKRQNFNEIEVYYFNGSEFSLITSESGSGRFYIYFSVAENSENYTSNGCRSIQETENVTIFTNVDYVNGYLPYQYCENGISIAESEEAMLTLAEFNYEFCCDHLTLLWNGNISSKLLLITYTWTDQMIYYLTGKAKTSQLIFNSDGNSQQSGFKVLLEKYECVCSNETFVIDCDNATMLYPLNGRSNYCDKLKCNYQILLNPKCSDQHFYIHVFPLLRPSDNLLLKANDNVNKIVNETEQVFLPTTNLSFHFESGTSEEEVFTVSQYIQKTWYASVEAVKINFSRITLNETNSKYFVWLHDMKQNDAVTVCTKTGTLEMQIFGSDNGYSFFYYLYDSNNTENFAGTLFDISSNKNSSSGCFTLLRVENYENTGTMVMFEISDGKNENCVYSNTIYQLQKSNSTDISIESTAAGACENVILSRNLHAFQIAVIQTNDLNSTIKFVATKNGRQLLTIMSSEASIWQSFSIYATAISISTSASSKVTVTFSPDLGLFSEIKLNEDIAIQKGIMTSPSYNGETEPFNSTELYRFSIDFQISVTFVVKYMDQNSHVIIKTEDDSFKLTNATISTNTSKFSLIYEETTTTGFLIEYTIKNFFVDPPTTTSETTKIPSTFSSTPMSTAIITETSETSTFLVTTGSKYKPSVSTNYFQLQITTLTMFFLFNF